MGGGTTKSTSNNYSSGFAESQYDKLSANDDKTLDAAQAGKGWAEKAFNKAQRSVDVTRNQGKMTRNTVRDGNDALSGQMADGFTAAQTAGTTAQETMDTGFANMATGFGNMDTGFADMATGFGNMDTGFANMGTKVDGLGTKMDTNFNGLSKGMTQGFGDATTAINKNTNAGFTGTNAKIDGLGKQFTGFGNSLNSGFGSLEDLVSGGFMDAAGNLKTAQSAILKGQTALDGKLTNTGKSLDSMYGGLSAGQQALGQQIGGVQTGLSDFTNQYRTDVAQGNQARADLQTGMVNGFAEVRDDVGAAATAQKTGQQQLMKAVGGVDASVGEQIGSLGNTVEGGFMSQQQATAQAIQQAAQQQQQAVQQAQQQQQQYQQQQTQQVAQRIAQGFDMTTGMMDSQVKDLASATSMMGDMDKSMRQEFYQLGNAFDDNGSLIRSSVDSQGNTLQRAIDNNGNLMIRAFDQTGRTLGDRVININQSLQTLAQLQTQPGQNSFMGGLSAPMQARPEGATPVGGFMSPFAISR